MSTYREIRDLKRDSGQTRVAIREVNLEQNYVSVEDAYGGKIQISFDFHSPLLAVPNIGETWIADRSGLTWTLTKKLNSGDETIALTDLQPGDQRIDASNDLYLSAKGNVHIKGSSLVINDDSFSDSLTSIEDEIATLDTEISSHEALTTTAHGGIVASTDSRLTDQRTPLDNSVTNAKVPIGAAIDVRKINGVPKFTTTNLSVGPPSSPSNGDIWIAQNVSGSTAESWTFAYDSGEVGSFKWKFLGGAPLLIFLTGAFLNGDNSAHQFWAQQPPRNGDYLLRITGRVNPTGAGAGVLNYGFSINGAGGYADRQQLHSWHQSATEPHLDRHDHRHHDRTELHVQLHDRARRRIVRLSAC
jgi:hypothetical protein